MVQVLVAYFSVTGHTEAMAEAVAEGVRSVSDVVCGYKPVAEVDNDDLLAADGIIIGSPTYFGQMAAEVKKVFDVSERIYDGLAGKVGGAFTTSGGAGCGHELTNMSIITAMLVNGMIVQGTTKGPHFGPFAVGAPDDKDLARARDLGVRVAELTRRLAKLS
jgi:NAD(P)H dehydrogenase (quinone)